MSRSSSYSTTSPPSCSLSSAIILSWCGVFLSCLCGCELFFFFSPLIFRGISLQFKTCRISTHKFMNEAPSNRHFRDANLSGFFFQPTSLGSRNRAKKRIDPIPGPQTAQPTSTKLQTRFTKKKNRKTSKKHQNKRRWYPQQQGGYPQQQGGLRLLGKKTVLEKYQPLLWMILCSQGQLHHTQLNGCIEDQLPKGKGFNGFLGKKIRLVPRGGSMESAVINLTNRRGWLMFCPGYVKNHEM